MRASKIRANELGGSDDHIFTIWSTSGCHIIFKWYLNIFEYSDHGQNFKMTVVE